MKFTPKLNLVKTSSKGEKNIEKPANIKKLLPSIPAKLPKKVNKISKFFKKNNSTHRNKETRKLYTQVSHLPNNTRKVLKIKKMFLIL